MNKIDKIKLASSYLFVHLSQQWVLMSGLGSCKPSLVCALVNWQCNFKCYFCFHPYYGKREILSLEDWQRILSQLRSWLGTFRMNFLGGEPFLRNDFIDILAHARKLGIMSGITTNASLITEEIAKELSKLDLFSVGISIDGIKAETHEYARGCPGMFDKAMAGIANLKKYCKPDMKIVIRTIIMEKNIDEIIPIVNWIKDWGLTGVIIQPLDYAPILNPVPPPGETLPVDFEKWIKTYSENQVKDLNKIDILCDELIAMKKEGAPILNEPGALEIIKEYFHNPTIRIAQKCQAGVQNFMIVPNGDVHTCVNTVAFEPIGNLKTASPKEIWTSEKAKKTREDIRKCERTCLFFSHAKRSLIDKAKMFIRYI
ncbi:MAG: radical SAM protein [Candidatus Coatesbacteria bacterium]|nr:radical SAM protein [Candidatus Coatesbacteria bacterium]